jgi:hypothetical protein
VRSFYIPDFSIEINSVAPIARAAANPLNYCARLMGCEFVSLQQRQQSCPSKQNYLLWHVSHSMKKTLFYTNPTFLQNSVSDCI